MPATELALEHTDRYRAQLLDIRRRAITVAGVAWEQVNADDLERTFVDWRRQSAAALATAQRAGLTLTAGYLGAYLSAELDTPERAEPIDVEGLVGHAADGRPIELALQPAIATVAMALRQRRGRKRALQMGLNRATRTVSREFMFTVRAGLDESIADDRRVLGWRRATSGNACGACLGAATGAIHQSAEVLRVHDHCRCIKEPVIRGVRERHRRPTGRELFDGMDSDAQDVLFRGRGGAEKAELIRSGRIDLSDLVATSPMATVADGITEAPLSALR